jgi:hypothetical protein
MSVRRGFPRDYGLSARMVVTLFLLGLVYVAFIAVLLAVGLSVVIVLIIAGGLLFAQWWFSDRIALFAMGGREVSPEEAPQLHGLVDRLCAMADMPKPRVAIADTDLPNAFATGRSPRRAVVCATTGIMRRLDPPELEGVLAHELSHVAHRDVTVMTVAGFLGVLAGLITRVGPIRRLLRGVRRRRRRWRRGRRRQRLARVFDHRVGIGGRLRHQFCTHSGLVSLSRTGRRSGWGHPYRYPFSSGVRPGQDHGRDGRYPDPRPAGG